MHCIDRRARRQAGCDIGLIGDDNGKKSGGLETPNSVFDPGQQPKILDAPRREGFAVADKVRVEDAIAIEKHGALLHGTRILGKISSRSTAAAAVAIDFGVWPSVTPRAISGP